MIWKQKKKMNEEEVDVGLRFGVGGQAVVVVVAWGAFGGVPLLEGRARSA
jgi:hypothetical protein